jgi:hypothetical protein
VQMLLEHDLVDEFRLMIDPLLLGGGKGIFRNDGVKRPLRLVAPGDDDGRDPRDLRARRVVERPHPAARSEPRRDERVGQLGLAVEEPHANGEDHIEAAVAEVGVLDVRDEELGLSGIDVRGVPARGGLDHLRRPVNRGQPAAVEPLADHGRGHAVAASDLEHAVVGTNAKLIDDGLERWLIAESCVVVTRQRPDCRPPHAGQPMPVASAAALACAPWRAARG